MRYVPVVDTNNQPLMPTTPARARRWIKHGKATGFWKRGIYCVRLNQEPSAHVKQAVVIGCDPGAKREGFSVKSEAHTYVNLQSEAITWVKESVTSRREMRRTRRYRKTPYRKCRSNRAVPDGCLPPSTKARWGWKLRILDWLAKIFPVESLIVEDIQAETRTAAAQWNTSFSPLEVGKNYFYTEIKARGWELETLPGHETKRLRDAHGLKKTKHKLAETFSAHCVDSWVLANHITGGHTQPDNTELLVIKPLRFHRRQLHKLQPAKGGERALYGSTRSLGFERGSLVTHPKWRLTYVGGTQKDRVTLHSLESGERLCRNAKVGDLRFLTFNRFTVRRAAQA